MKPKKAFTLIELLVVVAIIAVLISLLLPALGQAREMAKKAACGSNMNQIARSIYFYAQDNHSWLPAYERYTTNVWYQRTGAAFGNYTYNLGGIAKLVKKPSVSTTNTTIALYLKLSYAQGVGYLENCDVLFCPGDTTYAPLRVRNPIDTHGWAPYEYTSSMTSATDFNASGYWYMNVPDDERVMGYQTFEEDKYYEELKRYKVDGEDSSQKTILTDLGHCPQFGVTVEAYKMSHQQSGWNTLYTDGHVRFHQLGDVYGVVGAYGYSSAHALFVYFDQHP